jgi:hypothetical protein
MMHQWIAEGALPSWAADVLAQRPVVFEITETAFAGHDLAITTYHSPSFALGVSTKEFSDQSDVLMVHYTRPGAERPGVVYTRYLTDDKWLGDFYHATDRTKSRNLIDEGLFYGVQQGPRAIGLYTPRNLGNIFGAKATLIWTRRDLTDEIWIGDRRVETLPAEIGPGETVVVGSGDALVAVRPLTRTDLGRDAPIRLTEIQGDLVLELYNYLGPQKSFWELNWPGAFYKGRPQCGFYVEVAERSAYPDGRAFGQAVASGVLKDVTAPPFTYRGEGERPWTVEYTRDEQTLGIEIDLMAWTLKRRWTHEGDLGWLMLQSPVARETRTGRIAIGGATLTCGPEASWLFASPATGRWVAGYHGLQPAPLTLTVPDGSVEITAMGTGTLVWDNGQVTVEAVGLQGAPVISDGYGAG